MKTGIENFKLTVAVNTKNLMIKYKYDGAITIFLKAFLDKIFQPFFNTKPTRKETGLGLSLSDDIVKAHNKIKIVGDNQRFYKVKFKEMSP